MKIKKRVNHLLIHIFFISFSTVVAFPFFWMVSNSIKTKDEIWSFPPVLLPKVPQWVNYTDAFRGADFGRYMFNSTFTSLCITLIIIANSAMMAYAFSQLNFRGKNLLFALVLCTYMLPSAATYVPSYIILAKLKMLDSYQGLIISSCVSVLGIFLSRQAFMQIDKDFIESAKIDGANHWRILWRILFPMTRTTFVTLGILTFIGSYNSYLWPSLIIKSKKLFTVTMGLNSFFMSEGAYGLKWGAIMAACTIITVPLLILFFICQKWIIEGVSVDSGTKG